jgi:Ca-activated chloride channel family protein
MRRLSSSLRIAAALKFSKLFVLLACLPWLWTASAQFRSDTRLVVLHASVNDKKGKLLTNLERNAFKVFENGQPQAVKVFRREDVPVSLGIIIDDSGSMMNKRARVETAALAMVRESSG